jgi:hypothetical protein
LGQVEADHLRIGALIAEACWLMPPADEGRQLAHSGWTRSIIQRALAV